MERAVTPQRPKDAPRHVTIMPAPEGWRISGMESGEPARVTRTMEEAAASVPGGASVRLSLPVSAVLMERMRLPSTDREELGGMVVLQLEKTLPYGSDELTSGFEIIRQEENESDLLAVAVSNEQLDGLCEALKSHRKLPDLVSIYALQLAAKFPAEEVLALIFREGDSTILAIAEHGKLVSAHAAATLDRDEFLAELPRIMLSAELEGAPVNFTRVAVEAGLASWTDGLRPHFGVAGVVATSVEDAIEQGVVNLVPTGWRDERQKLAKAARVKEWLTMAGIVYLILLLCAAGWIIWLQHQLGVVDAQVRAAEPAITAIANRTSRWNALSPATDPTQFTIEILQQAFKSRPSDDLKVTVFDQTPTQFMVEGEAPNASMAIQYVDALRANPALKSFRIEGGPPEILPNEHAHFRIFGKL